MGLFLLRLVLLASKLRPELILASSDIKSATSLDISILFISLASSSYLREIKESNWLGNPLKSNQAKNGLGILFFNSFK